MKTFMLYTLCKQAFSGWRRYGCLCLLACLLLLGQARAEQIVWTGEESTDWTNEDNWDPSQVPDYGDDVRIEAGAPRYPVIGSGVTARIGSMWVFGGASLTINSGGMLRSQSPVFVFAVQVTGTLTNRGSIYLPAFLDNRGTVSNYGLISVKDFNSHGIINAYNGQFTNQSGGEIDLDRLGQHGILNKDNSYFNNFGDIYIGQGDTPYAGIDKNIGEEGMFVSADFTNEASGRIYIDRVSDNGIKLLVATFTNYGEIYVGTDVSNSIEDDGIDLEELADFENYGFVEIDNVGSEGIILMEGTSMTNAGAIRIPSAGDNSDNGNGILTSGVFLNTETGLIDIGEGTEVTIPDDGIDNTGEFTNLGAIYIRSVGSDGILQDAGAVSFQNHGLITLDDIGFYGIKLEEDVDFDNFGVIIIYQAAFGLDTDAGAAFFNQECADITMESPFRNEGTITNYGLFSVLSEESSVNSGSFVNLGVLGSAYSDLPDGGLNNQTVLFEPLSASCPDEAIPGAIQFGPSYIFTIGNTWYRNGALTQPAGAYDAANNVFTPNLPPGEYLLYVPVTGDTDCLPPVTVGLTILPDDEPPTVVCKDAAISLDGQGRHQLTADDVFDAQLSSDNCGNVNFLSISPAILNCDDAGTMVQVTVSARDDAGNQSNCMATVTVRDDTDPTALCRDVTIQLDAGGIATITAADLDDVSIDNCGIIMREIDDDVFGCDDVGLNAVTLTVTDPSGNSNDCTANVTVEDITPPTAACKNLTVQLDADGLAVITAADVDGGSGDNCDFTLSLMPATFDCDDVGANVVTLTATDDSGNSDDCPATVTVRDELAPVVSCSGGPIVFNGEDEFPITDAVTAQATDACGVAQLTYSPTTIGCDQIGETVEVIVTAADVNGNVGRCTTYVEVGGLPCGFIGAAVGCASQADYDPATGTFSIQTDNCNSGSPYHDELGAIAYQLCGNGSISFRVAGLSSQNAFAGIFLRTGPQADAVKAEVVTNRYFTARGAVREHAGAAAWPLPFYLYGRHWFRLERWGGQVRVYTSPDGQSWTILMARNLSLPNCVYVGMMAYGPGAVTATFDDVKVNGSPLQTGPLQTGGGGFPLEEAFLKPSTVGRLPSTEAPLPSPAPKGSLWERGETGPLQTSPEGGGSPLEEALSTPSTVHRLPFTVYPNPTSGQLTVELPTDLMLDGATLEVLDGYGRSVLRETELDYQQRLDLSRLPAGAYFVRLQTAGEAVTTRVVVQQ